MNVSIDYLNIRRFKGCPALSVNLGGAPLSVFGDNGTGKTTIADAPCWLLFDCDSEGRSAKKFGVKPQDEQGNETHHVEPTVEMGLLVDGERITLKKALKEQWVTAKGSAIPKLGPDENLFWVNGVPRKAGEFNQFVAGLCTFERFKLLTDPAIFCGPKTPWQDRRRILVDSSGDVTVEQIIASNPDLANVPKILGKNSPEDAKRVLKDQKEGLVREQKEIPIRIDQESKALPAVGSEANWNITTLSSELSTLRNRKSEVSAGGRVAEISVAITNIDGQMMTREQAIRHFTPNPAVGAQQKVRELDSEVSGADLSVRQVNGKISVAQTTLAPKQRRRQELLGEYEKADASVWEGSEECSTCGQPLPPEKIAEARGNFNQTRSKDLERIAAEGTKLRGEIDTIEAETKTQQDELALAQSILDAARKARLEYKAPESTVVVIDLDADAEYSQLKTRRANLVADKESAQSNVAGTVAEIDALITEAEGRLQTANSEKAKADQRASGEKRVKELEARHQEVGAELERVEQSLYLLEQFTRAKVSMLTGRINAAFPTVRWKLFDETLDGGLIECCEAMVASATGALVPFKDLNHAARINAGLEIINVLADHFKFSPFVMIDGAESVTRLTPTAGQQVRLVVSEADKSLRFESEARSNSFSKPQEALL